MYILLTKSNTVAEIIPDEDPVFPGMPIGERYARDFVEKLMLVPDGIAVEQNWVYDPVAQTFSEPPQPEPEPESDLIAAVELDTAYQEGVNSVG